MDYLNESEEKITDIQIIDRNNNIELSYAQQRLWFIDQMDEGSSHYNTPGAMKVNGDFRVDIAQLAFTQIIQRHEPLRTVFVNGDTGPSQVIRENFQFTINETDLRTLNRDAQQQAIEVAITQDAQQAFDLSNDLMLRVSYLSISDDEGVMLFNMHHIASDGWSIGVMVAEFVKLYRSNLEGQPSPLTPLAIQYVDYAYWQRNWLHGKVLNRQLNYWKKQLSNLPQVHSLPLDFERPTYQTFNGAKHGFKLDISILKQLKSIALENHATLFMLVHAAFSLLLSRYSNNTDIVIGTPVANRIKKELEPLIGFFVNTLVLRTDCSGNPGFLSFLEKIK
ncbi:MAG: hypothetical protein JKY19_07110, partial [Alcanivoracaceae bacterium]|nr:hypothetical protein [Alcanivoracaceae bacterium]